MDRSSIKGKKKSKTRGTREAGGGGSGIEALSPLQL